MSQRQRLTTTRSTSDQTPLPLREGLGEGKYAERHKRHTSPQPQGAGICLALLSLLLPTATASAAQPRARALVLVDNSAYPELKAGLERYAAHVLDDLNIAVVPRPDDYYRMQPPAIREILRKEYQAGQPPLVGAIMAGPIPHALRSSDPNEILIPCVLFYEDFDAVYEDCNGDGAFSDAEITNDRANNPTEIWTAWWVPPCPADDRTGQVKLLKAWLDKLDRYYRGDIVGRDQMLWLAGNVVDVEICEGWTVLLKDTMRPLDQKLSIWSRIGQDEGTFRPNKRKDEFGPKDLLKALSLQPWQHCHLITHGNPRGWYWESCGVVGAPPADGAAESVLTLDFAALRGLAGNIVTTSGCSNGNFRGDYVRPSYERALGNLLLFSPDTITIAYYGSASPQSTGGFAGYCTELIESLKADGGSYLGDGYRRMRNADYSWGTQHYFFRGGDEKVLSGDPFAHYRDSRPPSPEQVRSRRQLIDAAGWTVVGPG